MLDVEIKRNDRTHALSLVAIGHAGNEPNGQNIICAAASMLVEMLAFNVAMCNDIGDFLYTPKIKKESGHAEIKCVCSAQSYGEVARLFFFVHTGFIQLSINYPDEVCVNTFDDMTE